MLLCFRLYYRGDELDPDFPEPVPPKNIVVPAVMPNKDMPNSRSFIKQESGDDDLGGALSSSTAIHMGGGSGAAKLPRHPSAAPPTAVTTPPQPPNPSDDRRRLLQEVREHLDLLKEFEDFATEEELAQRRKELYAALPPAPPPFTPSKKQRVA